MRVREWLTLAVCCAAAACEAGGVVSEGGATADPNAMLANGMTARQMMEARALHMKDLGGSFKAVRDQLATESPNVALVQIAAREVAYAATDLPTWFPPGTGPETGVETRSFAEVWTDAEGFAAAAKSFQDASAELRAATDGTDLEAMRTSARAVGKTCGSCHDAYRAEED